VITHKGKNYSLVEFLKAGRSVIFYEFWLPIYFLPSRLLFGNFIGYFNNVAPLVQIGLQRLKEPQDGASAKPSRDALALRTNGFLMLPRNVAFAQPDASLAVETIAGKCNELLNGYDGILLRVKGLIFNIYRPLERIPELRQLITDEIDQTIRSYYGSSYQIHTVQVWRNQFIPHSDPQLDAGIANAFHNDGSPCMDLRLFVLLNDAVTRETGALRFHDKSASRRISSRIGYFSRRWQTRGVKQLLLDPGTLRFFEGNIGDACLINTQVCLHAASIPKPGSYRDVVQFEIKPSAKLVLKEDIYANMMEDSQVYPSVLQVKTR
jgi:hypothetical protein